MSKSMYANRVSCIQLVLDYKKKKKIQFSKVTETSDVYHVLSYSNVI